MDRAQLECFLGAGLSLEEIGKRVGKDHSTIGYWIHKHDLKAVGCEKYGAKGQLHREELEALIAGGASLRQIAQAVGRSTGSVRHWLKKYSLRTGGRRGARSRDGVQWARAEGLREAVIVCGRHGAAEHVRESRGYYRCRRCRAERVVRRRQTVKKMLVEEAGGGCEMCGYSRCIAALEFHHRDPAAKEFGLARCGARSIERLRAEVRKCVLLCSNCHAEVESGAVTLP